MWYFIYFVCNPIASSLCSIKQSSLYYMSCLGVWCHVYLLFILGALWYTMLVLGFPSLCSLQWYEGDIMWLIYVTIINLYYSLYFNTITMTQQISIIPTFTLFIYFRRYCEIRKLSGSHDIMNYSLKIGSYASIFMWSRNIKNSSWGIVGVMIFVPIPITN